MTMKNAFALHLAGRMLPGLFSCDLKIGQRERFPGDPWPHFPASPTWHWMHTTECGAPNHIGSCLSRPIKRDPWPDEVEWISSPAPATNEQKPHGRRSRQVLKAEGASPDATDRDSGVITSSGVGPTSVGQPADAGPQSDLFAEDAPLVDEDRSPTRRRIPDWECLL